MGPQTTSKSNIHSMCSYVYHMIFVEGVCDVFCVVSPVDLGRRLLIGVSYVFSLAQSHLGTQRHSFPNS